MTSTDENIMAAFAGESQANRKYLAYAKKAEKDGYPQLANLFRAVAEAETVHAHNHLRVAGKVELTEENVKAAIGGEHYEIMTMYPEFVQQAEKDGKKAAQRTFEYALAVEKIHHRLFKDALKSLNAGKDLPQKQYYICPVCGNTFDGELPDRCPICNVLREKFYKVE